MTTALIDSDIVAFRSSAAAENEDLGIALHYVDRTLEDIVAGSGADSYQLYLTGKGNFRYKVFPEYKQGRAKQQRPRHLASVRDYLIDLGAVVSDGCEADDLLGVAQCTGTDTVIVSLDKDLLMIPGPHYSWEIKGKGWVREAHHTDVSEVDALRWFYTQLITGDPTDGIKGVQGVGKKGAERALAGLTDEADLLEACRSLYSCDEEMLMNGQCLWIWRKMDDIWAIPGGIEGNLQL